MSATKMQNANWLYVSVVALVAFLVAPSASAAGFCVKERQDMFDSAGKVDRAIPKIPDYAAKYLEAESHRIFSPSPDSPKNPQEFRMAADKLYSNPYYMEWKIRSGFNDIREDFKKYPDNPMPTKFQTADALYAVHNAIKRAANWMQDIQDYGEKKNLANIPPIYGFGLQFEQSILSYANCLALYVAAIQP